MRYAVLVSTLVACVPLAQDGGAASAAGDGTVTAELTAPASVWYLVEAGGR